jgi:hypothetical protein
MGHGVSKNVYLMIRSGLILSASIKIGEQENPLSGRKSGFHPEIL